MQDVWTYLLNYPGGAPLMEVALTETNIDRKGSWPAGTTADTPSQFSGLAEMLIHDAYTDLGISGAEPNKSIYIAKFQQDADDPKGCFHMGASNQVGGATMLAEVVRLFAKGFSGALPRCKGYHAPNLAYEGHDDRRHPQPLVRVQRGRRFVAQAAAADLHALALLAPGYAVPQRHGLRGR